MSKAADVYAYGITLWELFTSGTAFQGVGRVSGHGSVNTMKGCGRLATTCLPPTTPSPPPTPLDTPPAHLRHLIIHKMMHLTFQFTFFHTLRHPASTSGSPCYP